MNHVPYLAGNIVPLSNFIASLPDTFWGEGKKNQVIAESGQISAP